MTYIATASLKTQRWPELAGNVMAKETLDPISTVRSNMGLPPHTKSNVRCTDPDIGSRSVWIRGWCCGMSPRLRTMTIEKIVEAAASVMFLSLVELDVSGCIVAFCTCV